MTDHQALAKAFKIMKSAAEYKTLLSMDEIKTVIAALEKAQSDKDLVAVMFEDLKREVNLKLKAMAVIDRLNQHLDTFKYANDLMTIVQIRDVISAPSAENLKGLPPPPNSKE